MSSEIIRKEEGQGGGVPNPLGRIIAQRLIPSPEDGQAPDEQAPDEQALAPPMPEDRVRQEIKTVIEQAVQLKERLNAILAERIQGIDRWCDDFSYDHFSSCRDAYHYHLSAYLDNPDGSATLFTMSYWVDLTGNVWDLDPEEESPTEDLHDESYVDWNELEGEILARLRHRVASDLGLPEKADPTEIAKKSIEHGESVSVRTYTAEQMATIEQHIKPDEQRSRLDFLLTRFEPREYLEGDGKCDRRNKSAKQVVDEIMSEVLQGDATIYPLGEKVDAEKLTGELVDSGRDRAAFVAAENITGESEYSRLARRYRSLWNWKMIVEEENPEDQRLRDIDQELAAIDRRLAEIKERNGDQPVDKRGAQVLEAMRCDVAIRWDRGVLEGISNNALNKHDEESLREFARLPGPLRAFSILGGYAGVPYKEPGRFLALQGRTLGLFRSARHMFGDDSEAIRGLPNKHMLEITAE